MIRCRYPTRVIVRDYLLAGVGLALFLLPVAVMNLPLVTTLIFLTLGGLFLIFGVQVYSRHRTRVELSHDGLHVAPGNRDLSWDAVSKLALSYFTVRRDGQSGWMELTLDAGSERLRLDSRMEGFTEIAARAAQAATDNRLELDRATVENLGAMGLLHHVEGRKK